MSRPLRIVHALCSDRKGGLEQAYVHMTQALLQLGHEVHAWIPAQAPYAAQLPGEALLQPFDPRGFYDPAALLGSWLRLKRLQPDLIMAHNARATSLLCRAHTGLGIPVMGVAHSYKHQRMRGVDHLLVLTEHMRQHHLQQGFSDAQVHLFPNMLPHFPEAPLPLKSSEPVQLGFIGRLDPEKGLADLLQALSMLKQRGKAPRLRVAGSGAEQARLIQQLQQLGLQDQVVFDGWITDIRGWLQSIDLLVVPSREETFGLVVLEGMAHGRPVLATSTPGPASLIQDGADGWLTPPTDPTSLAKALELALQSRSAWPMITESAYQKAQTYRMEALLPSLQTLLIRATGSR